MFLYDGPLGYHSGVAEQTHDYSAALACLLDGEEGLAGLPAVSHSLFIGLAGTLTNNHVEAVVAEIKALTGALDAVSYHCYCLVFENFKSFAERKFLTGYDGLFYAAKVKFCHNYDIMRWILPFVRFISIFP